jgi:tuftelin-interacting protein 11
MFVSFLHYSNIPTYDQPLVISRMQQINLVADDINAQAKELASVYEISLDPFSPLFSHLLVQFPSEFDRYRLDEIVVAAIAPLVGLLV